MQRNMTPMPDYAWALFAPGETPLSGKIIPMEGLPVEFALRPTRKMRYGVSLRNEWASPRCMGRFGKVVFNVEIRPNPHQKNTAPVLRDAEISRIEHPPLHSIAS